MSDKPLAIKGLVESVSSRIGAPWEAAAGTALTHCRLPYKDDKARSGVHVYPSYYSGILFLNAPEHSRGGTDFYAYRRTGLDGVPKNPIDLLAAGYNHPDKWIEDVVNNDMLRSENGRLGCLMFFNRKAGEVSASSVATFIDSAW